MTTLGGTFRRWRRPATAMGLVLVLAPCAFARADAATESLRRGLAYLWSQQQSDGSWNTGYISRHPGGVESVAVLAALTAGVPQGDPKILRALAVIDAADPQRTYSRAVRAMVYARLGKDHAAKLAADVAWLVKYQQPAGGWGYGPDHPNATRDPKWADLSNTHMALLALSQASDAGAVVPLSAWKRAAQYLMDAQQRDGGWAYTAPGATVLRSSSFGSMTAAATASLMNLSGRLPPGQRPDPKQILQGLRWLETNFDVAKIPLWRWGDAEYWPDLYLYCLARAGEGCGWGMGGKDWRGAIVERVLSSQNKDGSWSHGPAGEDKYKTLRTSFAMMALSLAARVPLVEQLTLPAPDPACRDAAELAALAGRRLGWRTSWQRAREGTPSVAPILLVVAAKPVLLEKEALEPLVAHVAGGGTLLVLGPANDAGFTKSLRDSLLAAFPDQGYEAAELPPDSPLFTAARTVAPAGRPKLLGIGDSVRTPILLAGADFRAALASGEPAALDVAENLILVATGGQPPALPGASARPRAAGQALQSIKVARVVHAGGSSACARALSELNTVLVDALNIGLTVGPAVSLKDPVGQDVQLLWITGSKDPKFSPEQRRNLADYVRSGGTVFIDSTVGRPAFSDAVIPMLRETFGAGNVALLDENSPLLTGRFGGGVGANVGAVRLSPAALRDKRSFELYGVTVNGRLGVIFSPLGVTAAMETDRLLGAATVSTDDALRLGANVALYALVGGRP